MSAPSSRRGFLAGLTALPLAGGGAALAADVSADQDLVDLWPRRVEAVALSDAASNRCDAIREPLVLPTLPEVIFFQDGDRALGLETYTCADPDGRLWYPYEGPDAGIRRWRRNHWRWQERPVEPGDNLPAGHTVTFRVPLPETQARADEIAAAWDRHKALQAEIYEASGLEAADAAWDAADDAVNDVEREIIEATARTFAGLVVKARLAQARLDEDDEPHPDLIAGLVRDILAMGGVPCASS